MSHPLRRTAALALLTAALGSVAQTAFGRPTGTAPTEALAIINGERQANGIPPLSLNPQWSQGCAEYDRYLKLNPTAFDTDAHHEKPGNPGYTALGALAAVFSELSPGDGWFGVDPFAHSPLHLLTILSPLAKQVGIAAADGYTCVTIQAIQSDPGATIFYSYPAPDSQNIPTSETVNEIPDPNEALGLASRTGPYLFVYGDGAWTVDSHRSFVVSQASLTAANGNAIAIKVVDGNTPRLAVYLDVASAMLVPVHPLAPSTTYTASVTVTSNGTTLDHSWSFTTNSRAAPKPIPVAPVVPGGGRIGSLKLSPSVIQRGQVANVQIAYRLSGPTSELMFVLSRKADGFRHDGSCLEPSWRSLYPAGGAPCAVWKQVKRMIVTRRAALSKGQHALPLHQLLAKGLAPGSYRLFGSADRGLAIAPLTVRP